MFIILIVCVTAAYIAHKETEKARLEKDKELIKLLQAIVSGFFSLFVR